MEASSPLEVATATPALSGLSAGMRFERCLFFRIVSTISLANFWMSPLDSTLLTTNFAATTLGFHPARHRARACAVDITPPRESGPTSVAGAGGSG